MEHFTQKLAKRKQENALRVLPNSNNSLIDFCSNDYLGFAKPMQTAQSISMVGSTGSRLLRGNHAIHEETEQIIALHHKAESALLFNSGYTANLGLIDCITERNHIILYDALAHASIRDGIRLSIAKGYAFEHNNLTALQQQLEKHQGAIIWVITESVFSMDGDQAPIVPMADLCEKYQANLIVDEAHALGVFGENGAGLVHELGICNKVFARIITFGKALGCHGAAIVGSNLLTDYLLNFCRAFIYTTALPPAAVQHIKQGYQQLLDSSNQQQLNQNIALFKKQLNHNVRIIPSISAIQCILISANKQVKLAAKQLQQKGMDVRPILSPTVPVSQERLRICLHGFNTAEEISTLTNAINEL
jgi:8-amino-7-oxononanoate synthase